MLDEALESARWRSRRQPGRHRRRAVDRLAASDGLEHAYRGRRRLDRRRRPRRRGWPGAMAELLRSILREGDVVGVDCGGTLTHIAPYLTLLPVATWCNSWGWRAPITANGEPTWCAGSVKSAAANPRPRAPFCRARRAHRAEPRRESADRRRPNGSRRSVAHSSRSVRGPCWSVIGVRVTRPAEEDTKLSPRPVVRRDLRCATEFRGTAGAGSKASDGIDERYSARPHQDRLTAAARRRRPPTEAVLQWDWFSSLVTDIDIAAAVLD